VTKRKAEAVTWATFEAYMLATFTSRPEGRPGVLHFGRLRGFLIDDPRWGIEARPEVWPKLGPHIYLPAYQKWSLDVVLESAMLIAQTIGPPGATLKAARGLMALWGPRGPLAIPREVWIADPGFRNWLDSRRGR